MKWTTSVVLGCVKELSNNEGILSGSTIARVRQPYMGVGRGSGGKVVRT